MQRREDALVNFCQPHTSLLVSLHTFSPFAHALPYLLRPTRPYYVCICMHAGKRKVSLPTTPHTLCTPKSTLLTLRARMESWNFTLIPYHAFPVPPFRPRFAFLAGCGSVAVAYRYIH